MNVWTILTGDEERRTRTALFAGIAIWFLHQNITYALASLSCIWGWFPFNIAGVPGLKTVELLVTVIALALILWMIYIPWHRWREFQTEKPTDNPNMLQDTEKDRRPLLAFIAMGLNSFFLLFVLGSFVTILTLNACAQG